MKWSLNWDTGFDGRWVYADFPSKEMALDFEHEAEKYFKRNRLEFSSDHSELEYGTISVGEN